MDRRRFTLAALASGALVPLASLAQQPQKVRRIGVLSLDAPNAPTGQQQQRLFRESLRRFGYEEGTNLATEWRFAEGKVERLSALAEELVRLKVELILTTASNEATAVAKRATRAIPIVMHLANDPVENGLVESLARPGGNVTGTTYAPFSVIDKQFQILKEAVTGATRVAVLRDPRGAGSEDYWARTESTAAKMGMTLQYFDVTRPEDIPAALERIGASRPDALYVSTPAVIRTRLREIVAFALERRLPSFGSGFSYVNAGGLLYYGPDLAALWNLTATYVDRILKGARPSDLPVEQPRTYELVINAKTARAIGYKIPSALQPRVDRVIE